MKPLEKGRRVLAWIGINFVDENAPKTIEEKCARKISPVIFRSVCIGIFIIHVITLLKVKFSDTEEYFYTLMQFVFIIHGSSSFITLISCSRISIMFQGLTEIYEKCKKLVRKNFKLEIQIGRNSKLNQFSSDPDERLTKLNTKFEWIYEHVHNTMVKVYFIGTVVASLISILICYIVRGEFDAAHLYRAIKVRLPWNQTTPIGYFFEMGFSIINLEAFWVVAGQILLIFIFMCRNNLIFAEMFVDYLNEFDHLENMQEKHKVIHKLIAFHTDIKM